MEPESRQGRKATQGQKLNCVLYVEGHFSPSSNRSLKWLGSYKPSSSRIRVPVRAQISSRRCQSLELRARRETSRPSTIPTRPMLTSVTSF